MEHGIELCGQAGVKVMAASFGLGPIDDPDGALEPRLT
jgi:hypothetical protein